MLLLREGFADQLDLLDALLPTELQGLPEPLAKLDAWLNDDRFFSPFVDHYHRHLGRPSIPAETYLRITALKHQYDLSDREICAAIHDRISWRRFCRIPWNKAVPHPSSLSKIRHRLDTNRGDHMAQLNAHLVQKAQEEKLIKARKVRVDTTAVEANIHHPTDASLISDGVKSITRLVKQAKALGAAGDTPFRNRTRSVKKRLLTISKVLRRRTGEAVQEVRRITEDMAKIAEQSLKQAEQVAEYLRKATKQNSKKRIQRIAQQLEQFMDGCQQVIEQARQVNAGNIHLSDRMVSLYDPEARPIRRGKAHKQNEFGYKLRLSESEEKLITEYEVSIGNPSDTEMVVPGVRETARRTGHLPKEAATDRGGWHKDNETALYEMGVQHVSIPFRGKCSRKRQSHERQYWFRRLQRWRAGQEASISVLKRRYGLRRSRYRGKAGCQRWVGGAVWGYNLRRIAQLG